MNTTKFNWKKESYSLLITLAAAALSAFALHVFIYPASFAPAGFDGIAAMLQELTGLNAGYYTVIITLPVLIAAYFILKKRYVIYTVIFIIASSAMLILLEEIGFYTYQSGSDRLLAAIFSGAIHGARTGMVLKIGAATGGVDIIGSIIHKYKPHLNIERIITLICYAIIGISYFVYHDITSILLSAIQMFIFDKFAASILKDKRNAIEFKIITKHPEQIKNDIIYTLKHGATVIDGRGMYTDNESSVIISVINIRQIPEFLDIIKKHPDTFVYYGEVIGVRGNFRWNKDDDAK